MSKPIVVEYLEPDGRSPLGEWFARLHAAAAAKVTAALYRLEQGNISNVRRLGKGISEYKIS